jgi:hypothetical protein
MKCEVQTYISELIFIDLKKKKIKKRENKIVQVYETSDLEDIVEKEEVFIVIPEKKVSVEKKEEQKPQKKSRLFKKHKKAINIYNVKKNLDAKMYTNRFIVR